MLILNEISVNLGADLILNKISLSVGNKDKVGLIGINGAGKSTLLKVILGKIHPCSGKVILTKDIRRIGYMPQIITDLDFKKDQTVFDFLLSGRPIAKLENKLKVVYAGLEKSKNEEERKKLLEDLGNLQTEFENWGGYAAENELMKIIIGMDLESINLDASVNSLSGGEKSKVAFARVLYSYPDILLLDEPTNHLDKNSRIWVMNFLENYSKGIIAVSHDAEFLDDFVNEIVRLDEFTRTAEIFNGNYSDFLKQWELKQKSDGRIIEKQAKEEKKLKEFIERMRNVSGKRKRQAQSREKTLEKLRASKAEKQKTSSRIKVTLSPNKESGNTPIRINSLIFSYSGKSNVFSELSLELQKNEKFVVIGKNGAGKSTLLKLIAGKLKFSLGEIIVDPKTEISYYTQEHEDLNLENTVLEEAETVLSIEIRKMRSILAKFLFRGNKVFQKVETLSPGERSRLALTKLALKGGNLLLLDEPTNHLDINTREIIADVLKEYGGTIVVVSHETDFLEKLGVGRMLLLPLGEIRHYDRNVVREYQEIKS